ncbi:hypothetical protein LIER_08780 [Lithospermum erythrorhizon]|uniref:Transposase n=1 Tax=Lithospermum erythrorhizon TaxID=34254 RepID=A0AAV3PDC6_LITER
MDHYNFDLNDIPINISNIDDDNNGSSEGKYLVFEINLNEMYHEDDDNIDQHVDSEKEVGDDGGAGEDFDNEMTSGSKLIEMKYFQVRLGYFLFVKTVLAQRRSRNRDVGTLEMKPITSVTRKIICVCLIEEVIPAITNVWPQENRNEIIYIQQDNARTHFEPSDVEFQMATSRSCLNLQLICQPPNSLDLNILELGFFSAIQSLQYKESSRTVEELVYAIVKSFNKYPSQKVNHVWLTLQLCMHETMKIGGSNRYKIPHIKKLQLERDGQLPIQVSCDLQVLQNVMEFLG